MTQEVDYPVLSRNDEKVSGFIQKKRRQGFCELRATKGEDEFVAVTAPGAGHAEESKRYLRSLDKSSINELVQLMVDDLANDPILNSPIMELEVSEQKAELVLEADLKAGGCDLDVKSYKALEAQKMNELLMAFADDTASGGQSDR